MVLRKCPFCASRVITFNGDSSARCDNCGITFTAPAGKSILDVFVEDSTPECSTDRSSMPIISEIPSGTAQTITTYHATPESIKENSNLAEEFMEEIEDGVEEHDFGDVDIEEQAISTSSTPVIFGGV